VLQRTLLFTRQDTDEQKVAKLAQVLTLYDMPDTLPLFTALLSLPTPAQYPPLNLTPQKQKERTFQALLQLMAAQAERMLHIAQHTQDAGMLLQAHMSLGVNRCMLGEFSVAQNHLEKAMSLHKPQLHWSLVSQYGYDPTMLSLTYTGITLWFLGRWDQAQEKSAEALTFARDLLHPMSLGGTFLFILWFYCLSRKEQNASTLVEESLSLAKEYNLDFLLAVCPIFKGRILLYQGKAEEGLQIIQETLSLLDTFRTQMYRSEYLSYLAQGYAAVGRIDDGLATLDQALAFVEKHDERYYEAELYRLKGELTLQQENQKSKGKEQKAKVENDAQAEAESCFRKAIDVAQQQQAKSWELRASTSLARLWQSQGKQAEAHKLLSEVYNWFTEGFDTKDLQEAKALLGELA
jgi:tetratricopeptide (TPR) repeat protein